jgi:hypothetical protein
VARMAAVAAACIATWFGVAVVMYEVGTETAERWRGVLGQPHGARLLYLAAALGLPTVASAWVASRLAKRALDSPTQGRVDRLWRWLKWPVLAGYVLTAAFGCPLVHNSLGRSMLAGHVALQMLPRCMPEVDTYVAVPLLPGVVLSYSESTSGCGTMWGAFLVHVWDGGAVRRLAGFQLWGGP